MKPKHWPMMVEPAILETGAVVYRKVSNEDLESLERSFAERERALLRALHQAERDLKHSRDRERRLRARLLKYEPELAKTDLGRSTVGPS